MTIDMVNAPPHYNNSPHIECIDFIRYFPQNFATMIKYVWRYLDKDNPEEDLLKAQFYSRDYAKHLFESKVTDTLFHKVTVIGAKMVMETKIRDQFRKHIVYLQEQKRPEVKFFEALYKYLQNAAIDRVSYDFYKAVDTALKDLLVGSAPPSTESFTDETDLSEFEFGNKEFEMELEED